MKARVCFVYVSVAVTLLCGSVMRGADGDSCVWKFDGSVDKDGVPSPWRLVIGSGHPQVAVKDDERGARKGVLWIEADRASYFLARDDQGFDPGQFPILEWSWEGIKLPTGGDVRKSSLLPWADNRNDQALQLLVRFKNGNVISYMWDSTAPVGTEVKENNPFANIMSVVVESGEGRLGQWLSYERNIKKDYRRLFNDEAPVVSGIAVQTNANHTRSQSEGYFDSIMARKAGDAGEGPGGSGAAAK